MSRSSRSFHDNHNLIHTSNSIICSPANHERSDIGGCFGFGLLTSLFGAAFQLSQTRRGGLPGYPSSAEVAGSAVGREMSQLGADVTQRNLNVQPTINVPVGFRFNVRVNRDMLFEQAYMPMR